MPPKNVAAPNAVKLFNCKICDKGYPRQTEYENHLRSYDHNHRQRLAEMKKITAANDSDNTRSSKRGLEEMRSIPVDGPGAKTGLGRGFKRIGVDTTSGASGPGVGFRKVGVTVPSSDAPSGFKKVGVTTAAPSAPLGFKRIGVEAAGSGSHPVAVTNTVSEPVQPALAPDEPVISPPAPATNGNPLSEGEIKAHMITSDEADGVLLKGLDEEERKVEDEVKEREDVVMGEDDEEESITWEEYDFRKPTGCDHANCPGCQTIGVMDEGWVVVRES